MFALLFLYICMPLSAHAAYAISERAGVEPPFIRPTGSRLQVNDPQFFLTGGTVADISIAPESKTGFTGDEQFFMQLFRQTDVITPLDCKTPTRSVRDWGISLTANDPAPSMVDFGPFTGNECAITEASSTDPIYAGLYNDDGTSAAQGVGWAFNAGGYNFSVRANDLPPPPIQGSSVLFLPGIAASRLYIKNNGFEQRVWEPDNALDADLLATGADGRSVNTVYTKDIVDSLYSDSLVEEALARAFGPADLDVYGGFEQFMNQLVASGGIKEWKAYPYDWRYDPFDIVRNGTLTEMPDGSLESVHAADILEAMASSSPTGKVTIIAHSNGGLVAKALASTLGADASRYIDRIILVGVPQFGTPQDIGSMLHGDGETYADGLVLYGGTTRQVTRDMPGLYALLPSSAYFTTTPNPVAQFTNGAVTTPYADAYGTSIVEYGSLERFLADTSAIDGRTGTNANITVPIALGSDWLTKAESTHAELDTWTPPAGITVTTVVGVDQPTAATLVYSTESGALTCDRDGLFTFTNCGIGARLTHNIVDTLRGDGTVIASSAAGKESNPWYFDTGTYANESGDNIAHRQLMAAVPIQELIKQLLTHGSGSPDASLTTLLPIESDDGRTTIAFDGDGSIDATDGADGENGLIQVPGTDGIALTKNDSHGVSVEGDGKSVSVPKSGNYKVQIKNTAPGSKTKVKVTKTSPDGTASTTEYTNIPTTASTTITVQVNNGVPDAPVVDENGDGSAIFVLAPGPAEPPTLTIPEQLHALFSGLNVRLGIKNRLLRALGPLEADETDRDAIANLEVLIKAQTGVKLSLDQGAQMLELLNQLKQ